MKNKSLCDTCKNIECKSKNKLYLNDEETQEGKNEHDCIVEFCSNYKKEKK